VLRGDKAAAVNTARFDVNLLAGFGVPESAIAEARAAASAAGFAAGWAQGQREAEGETLQLRQHIVDEAHHERAARTEATIRAVNALAHAAASLEAHTVVMGAELEALILETALGIAETVIGRELAVATEPGRDALHRALALVPTGGAVVVRLNPGDHAQLTDGSGTQLDVDGRAVTLVVDPMLAPGDALAESGATSIDARIGSALERIREVLA
jgi:flagellar assembly protein FliH